MVDEATRPTPAVRPRETVPDRQTAPMQMDPRLRLLLSSALMLFLELTLIRWTAANIVHLGYF